PPDPSIIAQNLRELADVQGYPPLVLEGFVTRDTEILRARSKTDRAKKKLMTATEFEAEKADWEPDGVVKPKGQLLKLTASQAEQLGLARFLVDTRDPAAVYARYGLDPEKVKDATPAWLDLFANFLKIPAVTTLLVIVAFTGLILEMKVPGTTIPGILAALCFILVFWAHTQFSGQIAVLAGMLFVLGLVLLMIEVFVTPGFGALGIFGILLMLGSLALVTMNEVPRNTEEWTAFGGKMATYLFGMMAGIVLAFTLGRFLPHVPYANRMMLLAPDDSPGGADEIALPGAAQAASLLGAIGTAATVLRPAGSVRFGDQYVDVVTEGGYVPAGSRVQVVEVEGNRIVVKEV
ncbi:MAG: NfeD family protein, partial [Fimbriiglobus sp.]